MTEQKQPSKGVLRKRCPENKQQIYRRTPMPKCDFNKFVLQITLPRVRSPVNLQHLWKAASDRNNITSKLRLCYKRPNLFYRHTIFHVSM